jgi:hypothetical protein
LEHRIGTSSSRIDLDTLDLVNPKKAISRMMSEHAWKTAPPTDLSPGDWYSSGGSEGFSALMQQVDNSLGPKRVKQPQVSLSEDSLSAVSGTHIVDPSTLSTIAGMTAPDGTEPTACATANTIDPTQQGVNTGGGMFSRIGSLVSSLAQRFNVSSNASMIA